MAFSIPSNSLAVDRQLKLSLPFVIPTSVIEESPQLSNLISQLTRAISPSGCSLKLEKEFEKAKVDLRFKKAYFLKNSILYQEMENLTNEHNTVTIDKLTESEIQVLKQTNKLLPLIDVVGCLDKMVKTEPVPTSPHDVEGLGNTNKPQPILELNHEAIETLIPQPDDNFVKQLVKMTKTKIHERCTMLLNYYQMDDEQDPRDIAELPAKLVADLEKVENLSQNFKLQQVNREWQFTQYEKAMTSSIDILQELLSKFRLHNSSDLIKKLAQYLCLKGKALSSKLELLQMEILCDTYTTESVPALEIINGNLKETCIEKEKTLTNLTHILNTYRSLGDEFDKLLVEYNGLKDTMENKKWALNKLK